MPRKASTQWDFGELFPAEQIRKVYSVAELTGKVRQSLEREFGQVWVSGEISNFRAQASGHLYFTLKDASSQLSCVLFRSERVESRQLLAEGQKIIAQGLVTVYEPRGQYQLRITGVEFQGVGALQVAFEKLKQKLQAEGLFAAERKRPLPRFPQRIGLVTSPTGAAIRDVLHVIQRRNPGLEIILAPSRVQGEGAGEEIAQAIARLNDYSSGHSGQSLDLILVTRGGGSIEDLWAFNEECVARAISGSGVPVVSAVGHEIDFTIADFVADLRAATPSAAAELITEGVFGSRQFVLGAPGQMARLTRLGLEDARQSLRVAAHRFSRFHPRLALDERLQRLDDLHGQVVRSFRFHWRAGQSRWRTAADRFRRLTPGRIVADRRERLEQLHERLAELAQQGHQAGVQRLTRAGERLRLLSPENVLARGYSITTDAATGEVIRDASRTRTGQRLRTRLEQGSVESEVS